MIFIQRRLPPFANRPRCRGCLLIHEPYQLSAYGSNPPDGQRGESVSSNRALITSAFAHMPPFLFCVIYSGLSACQLRQFCFTLVSTDSPVKNIYNNIFNSFLKRRFQPQRGIGKLCHNRPDKPLRASP